MYAAWATVDGERYGAAVSIGNNPTFDGIPQHQVEAHLLDQKLDLYDKTIELAFVDYIRPMNKFEGVDALVDAAAGRRAAHPRACWPLRSQGSPRAPVEEQHQFPRRPGEFGTGLPIPSPRPSPAGCGRGRPPGSPAERRGAGEGHGARGRRGSIARALRRGELVGLDEHGAEVGDAHPRRGARADRPVDKPSTARVGRGSPATSAATASAARQARGPVAR